MKFKTEKLNFKEAPIKEITKRSVKFYKLIKERRSVREFSDKKIDMNIIKNAILSAGTAPNGANLQPWHFVVVKDKKVKKKIRIAAENEELKFYTSKAPKEWLKALQPLGTDTNKNFIEIAPVLIAIFEKKYSINNDIKIKNYLMLLPPSTGTDSPVIKEASSLAKKHTTLAISSGFPILPIG